MLTKLFAKNGSAVTAESQNLNLKREWVRHSLVEFLRRAFGLSFATAKRSGFMMALCTQLFSAVPLFLAPWISLSVIKGGARVELHAPERPPSLTRNALNVSDTEPVAVTFGVGAEPGLWPNASTRALGRRLKIKVADAEGGAGEAMHALGTSLGMLLGYLGEDGRVDEVEAKEVAETLGVGVVNAAGTAFGPVGMLFAGFATGLYTGFTSPPLETQLEELKEDRAILHCLGIVFNQEVLED